MRFFIFFDQAGLVTGAHQSDRLPGNVDGGRTLPPNCIETDEATYRQVEWTQGYRVVDRQLVAPPPKAPVLELRAFFRLFTRAEVMAIDAQKDNDPDIRYFWTMLTLGRTVDLGHADTTSGLALLVSKSLLTTQRAAAIAANQAPRA